LNNFPVALTNWITGNNALYTSSLLMQWLRSLCTCSSNSGEHSEACVLTYLNSVRWRWDMQTWTLEDTALVGKNMRLSETNLAFQDQEEVYNLRYAISTPQKVQESWREHIHTKAQQESLRIPIPSLADWWRHFSFKPSQKWLDEVTLSSNTICQDNNNSKKKQTWNQQRNKIIL
jgi:hypothetical protein